MFIMIVKLGVVEVRINYIFGMYLFVDKVIIDVL